MEDIKKNDERVQEKLKSIASKLEKIEQSIGTGPKQTATYGSWKSPITSDLIVQGEIKLIEIFTDKNDLLWIESRPMEGGRYVVVRKKKGESTFEEVNPKNSNARTRVHEYGGAPALSIDGTLYYSNFSDQKIYKKTPTENEIAISKEGYRYSDGYYDSVSKRIFYVREDHTKVDGNQVKEPTNTVVSIHVETLVEEVVASGCDFYSNPRVSSDGKKLAYVSWNHPNMPWDDTKLTLLDLETKEEVEVAGNHESIMQPIFNQDNVLYFISDRQNGFWNLHKYEGGVVTNVYPHPEAEFGGPAWVFGEKDYQFLSKDKIICTFSEKDGSKLGILDLPTRKMNILNSPYSSISSMALSEDKTTLYLLGGSPKKPNTIIEYDISSGVFHEIRKSFDLTVDEGYLSVPQPIEFPSKGGNSYGYFYPPTNKDFVAPQGEKPPVLFKIHGGPTASTTIVLRLLIQYWTSRGFAIFDLNYSGSTGYGRAFRDRLKKNWGVADINDCEAAAQYLVSNNLVHPKKLCIDGGSAGGYTVMACLAFKPDLFQAGASMYGVADLELLAQDTHKFEARYLDSLIGEYPKEKEIYIERSPIHKVQNIKSPLVIYQGDEDKIVPPNQAEAIYKGLKANKVPVAYVLFQGEQHGFRKSENIKKCLDSELYFYSRIFGFKPSDQIEPLLIENLD